MLAAGRALTLPQGWSPIAESTPADKAYLITDGGDKLLPVYGGRIFRFEQPLAEEWPGATLFWSRDGGTTYTELASLTDGATLGTAATALAAPSQPSTAVTL